MMREEIEIVPLEESQIEAAGAAMARAFFIDHIMEYMFPDDDERRRLAPWHFSAFIRYGYLFGEVYTTSGSPDGTAVWFRPGGSELTAERIELAGLDQAPNVLGAASWARFSSVCDYVERLHPKEVPEPHWYLPLLGVDPALQGQGVGSALLKVILDRADRDGLPAYLWTAKARNVPFYQKRGFDVVTEGVEPTSGIRFWTMKR
ncbi:MAG: GNAT family N-acetyltransferase [Pyrinomonadaceae bacterium]|nr:GNAT family N-acetyltransferase [Pyrinomonadaceae bacterium]